MTHRFPPVFEDMLGFGLIKALLGRRSRRFFRGAEIPDGSSPTDLRQEPLPLSELPLLSLCADLPLFSFKFNKGGNDHDQKHDRSCRS